MKNGIKHLIAGGVVLGMAIGYKMAEVASSSQKEAIWAGVFFALSSIMSIELEKRWPNSMHAILIKTCSWTMTVTSGYFITENIIIYILSYLGTTITHGIVGTAYFCIKIIIKILLNKDDKT